MENISIPKEKRLSFIVGSFMALIALSIPVFLVARIFSNDEKAPQPTPVPVAKKVESPFDPVQEMQKKDPSIDQAEVTTNVDQAISYLAQDLPYEGDLTSITDASTSGKVKATFSDNLYYIAASVKLKDLEEGSFYKGWIVREKPFDYTDTGRFYKINDEYINSYSSTNNYTDYSMYVISEEKDERRRPLKVIQKALLKKKR